MNDNTENLNLIWIEIKIHNDPGLVSFETKENVSRTGVCCRRQWRPETQTRLIRGSFGKNRSSASNQSFRNIFIQNI